LTALGLPALIAVACCLPALAACGSSSHVSQRTTTVAPASTAPTGATVRTATCQLWRVLPRPDRERLLAAMRAFFAGQVDSPGVRGHVIADKRAYAIFTGYCREPFASAFLLYKLYANAVGFSPGV
jgi:hypothetical protein